MNPTFNAPDEAARTSHHGVVPNGVDSGAKIGREAEAKLALEHTRISRPVAWTMTLLFLLTIVSVPLLQHVLEIRSNLAQRRAEIASQGAPQTPILPRFYDVLGELPSPAQIRAVKSPQEAWNLVPSAARFKEHEDALQNDSYVVNWLLPPLQSAMLGVGVGNEQAYVGRVVRNRQWLHYRPDVDYMTSRGFLDPSLLKVRKRSGDGDSALVQPDPIRAIVDFHRQLKSRGIQLILMPTPVKAMMHPESLSSRYVFGQGVLQNPSFSAFEAQLKALGIEVFDVSPLLLAEMRRTNAPQYLETDTHWTPAAMELSARKLGELIRQKVALSAREPVNYTRRAKSVANLGDISEMLRLPAHQTRFLPQKVEIHQVLAPDGELWFPSRRADVLVLGDSFSNIYSLEGMKWGEGAGFPEQLSFYLQRPVDSITNNAGGSHVTRERLARGKNRLRGKRVVVWQFAMRDLLIGNWKILELPTLKRAGTNTSTAPEVKEPVPKQS
ncbi:MAG TPA: hypothetical protein VF627_10720 [Abditibacterium sp.]